MDSETPGDGPHLHRAQGGAGAGTHPSAAVTKQGCGSRAPPTPPPRPGSVGVRQPCCCGCVWRVPALPTRWLQNVPKCRGVGQVRCLQFVPFCILDFVPCRCIIYSKNKSLPFKTSVLSNVNSLWHPHLTTQTPNTFKNRIYKVPHRMGKCLSTVRLEYQIRQVT